MQVIVHLWVSNILQTYFIRRLLTLLSFTGVVYFPAGAAAATRHVDMLPSDHLPSSLKIGGGFLR